MEIFLVVIVVVAFGWPLAQLLLRRDIHRALKNSIRYRTVLAGVVGLYFFAVLVSILGTFDVKAASASVATIVLVYVLMRAHPSFGRWQGWVPGSLPLFNQMDLVDDRFLFKETAAHGPVFKTTQFIHPTLCVYGLERGQELIRRHASKLSFGGMRFSEFIPQGFIRFMDRSAHAHYRPILAKLMAPAIIQSTIPETTAAIREELRQLEVACHSVEDSLVRLHDHMPDIVLRTFVVLFFGVARDSDEMKQFEMLYRTLDCRNYLKQPKKSSKQALAEIINLVRATCLALSCDEKDGNQYYLRTMFDNDPSSVNDETLVGNIVCMLQLGAYDVAGLLLWILKQLSDHPAWQERLFAEVSSQEMYGGGELIDRIISETLRLEQSEFILRKTTDTFEFEGFRIPKGWDVRVCVRESHRDPALFDDPEQFKPDRFLGSTFSTRVFAPFGTGGTNCIGRHLSYAIAGVFLLELSKHYGWTVLQDGPCMNDGYHWAPNKEFSVCLQSKANSTFADG